MDRSYFLFEMSIKRPCDKCSKHSLNKVVKNCNYYNNIGPLQYKQSTLQRYLLTIKYKYKN